MLQSNKPVDYFKQLQIIFPKKGTYNFDKYQIPKINQENSFYTSPEIKLYHAELNFNELTLFTSVTNHTVKTIIIEDADGFILQKIDNSTISKHCKFTIAENLEKAFKVLVVDKDKPISNYAKIHFKDLLKRTNPNEALAKLNKLLNQTSFGDLELDEILEFINFDKPTTNSSKAAKTALKNTDNNLKDNNVKAVSEEEFNKNAARIGVISKEQNHQMELLESFLNNLSFGEDKEEDIADSSEQTALENIESGSGDIEKVTDVFVDINFKQGQQLKYKLHKTLDKINNYLINFKIAYENEAIYHNNKIDFKADFEKLNALLIGFHLILIKKEKVFSEFRSQVHLTYTDNKAFSKIKDKYALDFISSNNTLGFHKYDIAENLVEKFKIEIKKIKGISCTYIDGTSSINKEHHFFNTNYWHKNILNHNEVQVFLTNSFASFLVLLLKNEQEYKEETLLKWNVYKERLFYKAILVLQSYRWSTDSNYILLLLNMFKVLAPKNLNVESFKELLDKLKVKTQGITTFNEASIGKIVSLYKAYVKWDSECKKDIYTHKKELNKSLIGAIIFNNRIGFAKLRTIKEKEVVVESPLGFEHQNPFIGFPNIFIGFTPLIFNINNDDY